MRKRKLQIFLSSTYEDLIEQRLAAMEAILGAGHIPAAMEQFSPGDETAWERIKAWIDESDAFMLILGGRYGSIEPDSGKSYVQLEYEYAIEKKKPFFALVISDRHHEQRVRDFGLKVDERVNPQKYAAFKSTVLQRLSGFWNDSKDIKSAIFQKLPEWAQGKDLVGWVRGDEVVNPAVMNELARLSQENRELRASASRAETFDGLEFQELIEILSAQKVVLDDIKRKRLESFMTGPNPHADSMNLLDLFETVFGSIAAGTLVRRGDAVAPLLDPLVGFGLLGNEPGTHPGYQRYYGTEVGRRLRNRLLSKRRLERSQNPEQGRPEGFEHQD